MSLPLGKTVLRIESWSNAARVLLLRGLTSRQKFSFEHTTNANRSLKQEDFTLNRHDLVIPQILSVTPVVVPIRRGECYIKVTLIHEAEILAVLSSAYVTDSKSITWPPGIFEGSTEGPGLVRLVTGTDPAAGAAVSEAVPANARWRLLSILITLATDATVLDRRFYLAIDDGATEFFRSYSAAVQAASLARSYNLFPQATREAAFIYNSIQMPISSDLFMFQGWRLLGNAVNIQAGDDFAAPILVVEEWIEE